MTFKPIYFTFLLIPFLSYSQKTAKVVGIKDGDTIVFLLNGKTQQTLRLAEVDCPESGQAFGKNAKHFTSDAVFSAEIIKAGMGWWYYRYSDDESLGDLENKAKENNRGLWQDPNAIAPWDYRKLK